jgi:hypothetical protein
MKFKNRKFIIRKKKMHSDQKIVPYPLLPVENSNLKKDLDIFRIPTNDELKAVRRRRIRMNFKKITTGD